MTRPAVVSACVLATTVLLSSCGTSHLDVEPAVEPGAYQDCLQQLFGNPLDKARQEVRLAVVLRVVDACGVDKQIELIDHGPGPSVTVTVSKGASVRDQIVALRSRHPDKGVAELCGQVEVTSRSLTSPNELAKASEFLRRLDEPRFFAVPQTDFYLHGRVYSLWIQRVLNRSHHEFHGPDEGASEEPLELWSFDVLRSFDLLCRPGTPG